MPGKLYRKAALLLTAWVCLLLGGCTRQHYEIEVRDDMSVRFVVECTVSTEEYEKLKTYSISTGNRLEKDEESSRELKKCDVIFQELGAVYTREGFTVEAISDAAAIGIRAVRVYAAPEEFSADLDRLAGLGLCGLKGDLVVQETLMQTSTIFTGEVSFVSDPDLEELDAESRALLETLYDPSEFTASVTLSMPGSVAALDGGEQFSENGARYTVRWGSGESTPVRLMTTVKNELMYLAVYTGLGAAGVAAFFAAARYLRIKRDEKRERDFYRGK